jgi:hypothetical protein
MFAVNAGVKPDTVLSAEGTPVLNVVLPAGWRSVRSIQNRYLSMYGDE